MSDPGGNLKGLIPESWCCVVLASSQLSETARKALDLDHFAQVTRFNWSAMVRGDMDEFFTEWDTVEERVKAPQILTLIDKLPGEEKRSAAIRSNVG